MLAVEPAQKIEATHSIEQRDEALNEFLKRRVADDSGGSEDDTTLS
jgi:hypothetical protein